MGFQAFASASAFLGLISGVALAALPVERVGTIHSLPPSNGHRVYVSDMALTHIPDGKLHIIDGDSLKYIGQLSTSAAANFTIAPDGSQIYIATTYYARLDRGERTDEVDVYDASTLRLKAEIPLPPKKVLSVPYNSLNAISSDGRLLFVQNINPASSISVVGLKQRKFLTELSTPGCYALFTTPSAPNRVTTLCGDGTLLTLTLSADGMTAENKRSRKFFDADKDPVFITAGHVKDRFFYISFRGLVYTADLSGEAAVIEAPWSIVQDSERTGNWRPGGYQMSTVQPNTGRLYVGMHRNGSEGSHKNPAEEIWTFDTATHTRSRRTATSAAIIAIEVSADNDTKLFAIEGAKNGLIEYDATGELKVIRRVDGFGDTPLALRVN